MAGMRGKGSEITVLKLGGSFLTDKTSPFVARKGSIRKVAIALKRFEGKIAVVHGGGSFGHPVALKYGISSSNTFSDPKAIFETRKAMNQLSDIICSSLEGAGLRPYSIPPAGLLDTNKQARKDIASLLINIMKAKMVPLTFGDVIPYKDVFTIVSGDYLSYVMCKALNAKRMCFLIDKPGILSNIKDEDSVVKILTAKDIVSISRDDIHDATGGLRAKLDTALKISSEGVQTAILSGFDTDALISFLTGGRVQGTVVKSFR